LKKPQNEMNVGEVGLESEILKVNKPRKESLMKSVGLVLLCTAIISAQAESQEKKELKTQKDSVSYSIGLDIGKRLKQQSVEIDADLVARGMKDAESDSTRLLTEDQAESVINSFQHQIAAKLDSVKKALGTKNKADGEAFLTENKKKEGVIVLPDGLQYKVLKEGNGKKPKADETVTVNYRGSLIDGTEFDSSIKRGEPSTFRVNGVIKGWTEALQLMPVGSKWQLFIPPELAYGERGAGEVIPPNATLIFEVELLSIK
jgi:FKBP-type peptidyl-prolyl cis-trans isomerase FklB